MTDTFYRDFEERYRGSRELIKARLGVYVPFITPLTALYQPATAMDLGCGRGEWLELLGENGFDARGVDLDDGMLAACHERGLVAHKADAIQTLRALPDESTALVSAFHVIEHLPFADARLLVQEAMRVLKPGGLLILETPNPENLVVGTSSFYLDPSHVRPLPPDLLGFLAEHAGFRRHSILRLQEPAELLGDATVGLISVLRDVSPDYGLVAQKAAMDEISSGFDAAFGASHGLSLEKLAARHDQQANARVELVLQQIEHRFTHTENRFAHDEERIGQLEVRAGQTEHRFTHTENRFAHNEDRTSQLEARTSQLESRFAEVESRLAQAEARAEQYAARAEELTHQLHDILISRSWRATKPLRLAGIKLRKLHSDFREGKPLSRLKALVKYGLRQLGKSALRRPWLKRAAFRVLKHAPDLKQRLRSIIVQEPTPAASDVHFPSATLRTKQIYLTLKKLVEARKK
jgi:O-antigen chain-terminating methyltransferase